MFKKAKKQEKAERNRQKKAAGEVNPPAELADEALEQAAGGWDDRPQYKGGYHLEITVSGSSCTVQEHTPIEF